LQKHNYRKQIGNPKPWFNYECQLTRKNLRKRRRKFKNNRTSADHEEMKVFDKKYKNTLDKNMRLYREKMSLEIRNLKKSNSKEYRKILNRGKTKIEPNIPIESLFEYFKNLNETPID
jgi:phosphomevalonate kinase